MTYRDITFISFHQYNLFVTYNDIIFILFHRQLITNPNLSDSELARRMRQLLSTFDCKMQLVTLNII